MTIDEANYLFKYDRRNGQLFWRVARSRRIKVGQEAGTNAGCYRQIIINKRTYKVHRIIWLMHYGAWPKYDIDHIDGNGLNNRIENLRDVPRYINQRNQKMKSTNKSGFNGVSWSSERKKWVATITINFKQRSLGRFDCIEDAVHAREMAQKNHGFTNRHGTNR